MKCATKPDLHGEDYIKKSKEALSKIRSLRENFRGREKKITADLEKAHKIWKELGQRFRWWGSLP